jgi:putative transposase
MPRKSPPRLRTFDYTGLYRYFLTISTFRRSPVFVDCDAARIVTTQLARAASSERFSVIAYCLMPDHLHLLAEATCEAADFQRFVRIFKQQSAFYWKRETGQPLWHRSYFERVLRDGEDTIDVIRYILGNPVRAGLAAKPDDYRYLGTMTGELRDLLDSIQM